MAQIKLGELLIKANVLQEGQLRAALAEQHKWGGKLGDILVRMNLVTEDLLVRALSRQLSLPAVDLDAVTSLAPHVRARIPADLARATAVVPLQLRDDGRTLVVAMADPLDVRQLDELRAASRCRILTQVAGRGAITRAIRRFYGEVPQPDEDDPAFKVLDPQGRALSGPPREAPPEGRAAARPTPVPAPSAAPTAGPVALLRSVDEAQRRQARMLEALVDLLIEKGVFTREEYLARLGRPGGEG